jgi:hypothetical protein
VPRPELGTGAESGARGEEQAAVAPPPLFRKDVLPPVARGALARERTLLLVDAPILADAPVATFRPCSLEQLRSPQPRSTNHAPRQAVEAQRQAIRHHHRNQKFVVSMLTLVSVCGRRLARSCDGARRDAAICSHVLGNAAKRVARRRAKRFRVARGDAEFCIFSRVERRLDRPATSAARVRVR